MGADFRQQEELLHERWTHEQASRSLHKRSSMDVRWFKHTELAKDSHMARVNEMLDSKYLKQSDVPEDTIVTVRKIGRVNLAKEGDPPEEKWAVMFKEFNKPMLLNSTNIKLLEKACGSDDTDDWIGKEVIVYTDENVSFGGQVTGGLRIRKQRQEPARKTEPAGKPAAKTGTGFDDMDSDIPFDNPYKGRYSSVV